jgi:hypothetical protein
MLSRCTATRNHPRRKARRRSFLLDFHYFILKNCQIHKAYFYLEIIHSPKKNPSPIINPRGASRD